MLLKHFKLTEIICDFCYLYSSSNTLACALSWQITLLEILQETNFTKLNGLF